MRSRERRGMVNMEAAAPDARSVHADELTFLNLNLFGGEGGVLAGRFGLIRFGLNPSPPGASVCSVKKT